MLIPQLFDLLLLIISKTSELKELAKATGPSARAGHPGPVTREAGNLPSQEGTLIIPRHIYRMCKSRVIFTNFSLL